MASASYISLPPLRCGTWSSGVRSNLGCFVERHGMTGNGNMLPLQWKWMDLSGNWYRFLFNSIRWCYGVIPFTFESSPLPTDTNKKTKAQNIPPG